MPTPADPLRYHTLMDDEELAILGLTPIVSDTHALRDTGSMLS